MELTTSLAIESWSLYVVGVVVACRMASRHIKLGKWRALMVDDYLMVFALINFSAVVVAINEVAKNGSNYMAPEAAAALSPAGVQRAVYGSVMTFVLEILTLTATWTVKACLLMLYARLTRNTLTRQHTLVKLAAVYCAVTYLAIVFLSVFYWCSPTREYWAVPVKIAQCATYHHHMILATACNISSDLLLLLIPIPIIIKTRLAAKRKAILCCILGLGVFNILASMLNRDYNFSTPNSYVFLYWYVAEVGVAIMVGNLTLCWPVLRLAMGATETSKPPSYHGETISGSTRRKRLRNPLGTSVMGSKWDKLDDHEADGATSGRPHARRVGREHGSHMELVLQGHGRDHDHRAAVNAHGDEQPGSMRVGESASGGDAGDKIMVFTTVDVSSEPPR